MGIRIGLRCKGAQKIRRRTGLFTALSFLGLAFSQGAFASIEYSQVPTSDGTLIQTCTRYPDDPRFSGKRPVLMLILGSGRKDACRSLEKDYADEISKKGVILFARQKRGLSRNPVTQQFSTDLATHRNSDIPHLKEDTLAAFESLMVNPRVDSNRISLFGGSEGTILATYIGLRHPAIREITLVSTPIEPLTSVLDRQFRELIPQEMLQALDQNRDRGLDRTELPDSVLISSGLPAFDQLDSDRDGMLTYFELSRSTQRTFHDSLQDGNDSFFLSDFGGGVPVSWIRSAQAMFPLGPEVLRLTMPVLIHHGTMDQNTLVGPVLDLEEQVRASRIKNIHFTYYPGLTHELTRDILVGLMIETVDRLLQ